MRAVLLAAIALAAAACGGKGDAGGDDVIDAPGCDGDDCIDAPEPPCVAIIGDLSQPMELVPVTRVPDTNDAIDIAEGADLPLVLPFQGGFILLLGARVRNVDGCQTQVIASLRDPATGQVIGLEQRPSRLAAGADGWGHPTGTLEYELANVAVCPNFAGTRDVQDQPWEIEVRYETPDGRSATATRTVTPRCDPDSADCVCMCAADFSGGCSSIDGGRPPDVADAGAN